MSDNINIENLEKSEIIELNEIPVNEESPNVSSDDPSVLNLKRRLAEQKEMLKLEKQRIKEIRNQMREELKKQREDEYQKCRLERIKLQNENRLKKFEEMNKRVVCETCQGEYLLKSKAAHFRTQRHLTNNIKVAKSYNKEYVMKYNKSYKEKNEAKFKTQHLCLDCGGTYVYASKKTHLNSKKHKNGIIMKEIYELRTLINK